MTPRQEGLVRFLKEWGPLVAGVSGLGSSIGLYLFLALGFGLSTPSQLVAQLERRVAALEGTRASLEAVLRFLCYLDHDKAELAGIHGCPSQGNNIRGR